MRRWIYWFWFFSLFTQWVSYDFSYYKIPYTYIRIRVFYSWYAWSVNIYSILSNIYLSEATKKKSKSVYTILPKLLILIFKHYFWQKFEAYTLHINHSWMFSYSRRLSAQTHEAILFLFPFSLVFYFSFTKIFHSSYVCMFEVWSFAHLNIFGEYLFCLLFYRNKNIVFFAHNGTILIY